MLQSDHEIHDEAQVKILKTYDETIIAEMAKSGTISERSVMMVMPPMVMGVAVIVY